MNYPTPAEAIDGGVVYLTEDRKAQGLFLDMTVGDNINLGVIGRDAKAGGWLDRARARIRSLAAIKALNIRVPGPETTGRRPVRRQPAEGAAVAPAGDYSRRC